MYLHRFVLNLAGIEVPRKYEVDHINGDPIDNRLVNLSVTTHTGNMWNRHVAVSGVRKLPESNRWQARMCYNGERKSLGTYATRDEAENAYHQAWCKRLNERVVVAARAKGTP